MPSTIWIVVNGVFLLGVFVFLLIALKRLQDTPANRKLRTVALAWCVLFGVFLIGKNYMQENALRDKWEQPRAAASR